MTSAQTPRLTIAGSRTEGSHHVYIVRTSLMPDAHESAHRYSELVALHKTLSGIFGLSLPPFPAPRRVFKRASWVVREREILLQRFLDDVSAAAACSPPAAREAFAGALLGVAQAAHDPMVTDVSVMAATTCDDPRWDDVGFNRMLNCEQQGVYAIGLLRVGYAREVAKSHGVPLGARQELPAHALHFGSLPLNAELFGVSHRWLSATTNPDPKGEKLRDLVAILDREGAADTDLIFYDACSLHQKFRNDSSSEPGRTDLEEELFQWATNPESNDSVLILVRCYSRVRTVIMPRVPPGGNEIGGDVLAAAVSHQAGSLQRPIPYLDRGWPMFVLFCAAYCQRLLYSMGRGNEDVEELVRKGLDPARLADPRKLLLEDTSFANPNHPHVLLDSLAGLFDRMPPVPLDALGFRCFCERAQIAWLRVRLVREWAKASGPFPRRQELPYHGFIVGAPPQDRRKFVASHGWETEVHPSPSGGKMSRLADALEKLRAEDEDFVFLDFCSNSQAAKMGKHYAENDPWPGAPARNATAPAYFAANGVSAPLADRTAAEKAAFGYAMWDMGRLYSFKECEVIVLPELDLIDTFPGGDVWGIVNDRPYRNRGWCCAEFAVARYNGRIANLDNPCVQAVLNSREWPAGNTAEACRMYAEMMRLSCDPADDGKGGLTHDSAKGVSFTFKGDRAAVKYNFFKMTMNKESIGL